MWLADAVSTVPASRVEHPGNHRYAFRVGTCREQAKLTVAAAAAVPETGPWPAHPAIGTPTRLCILVSLRRSASRGRTLAARSRAQGPPLILSP